MMEVVVNITDNIYLDRAQNSESGLSHDLPFVLPSKLFSDVPQY